MLHFNTAAAPIAAQAGLVSAGGTPADASALGGFDFASVLQQLTAAPAEVRVVDLTGVARKPLVQLAAVQGLAQALAVPGQTDIEVTDAPITATTTPWLPADAVTAGASDAAPESGTPSAIDPAPMMMLGGVLQLFESAPVIAVPSPAGDASASTAPSTISSVAVADLADTSQQAAKPPVAQPKAATPPVATQRAGDEANTAPTFNSTPHRATGEDDRDLEPAMNAWSAPTAVSPAASYAVSPATSPAVSGVVPIPPNDAPTLSAVVPASADAPPAVTPAAPGSSRAPQLSTPLSTAQSPVTRPQPRLVATRSQASGSAQSAVSPAPIVADTTPSAGQARVPTPVVQAPVEAGQQGSPSPEPARNSTDFALPPPPIVASERGAPREDGRGSSDRQPPAWAPAPSVAAKANAPVFHLPAPGGPAHAAPAAAPVVVESVPATLSTADAVELPRQIVQAIKLQWNAGGGEARIKLNPGYLGELSVAIKVDRGVVTASMESDTPAVRQWLQGNEPALRQALADQGLQLERLVVAEESAPERHGEDERREKPQRPPQQKQPSRRPRSEEPTFEVVV